jgi:hypothetical protein
LEVALQYRFQYEIPDKCRDLYQSLTFYLEISTFLSGADGIRTHALRRAKAALSRLSYGPDLASWGEFTAVAQRGLTGFAFGVVPDLVLAEDPSVREPGRPALTEGLCEI